ncbi:MAG: DUF1122 family protein, partial [Candidatus Heimdallarchaeaceae archaeon]
LKELETQNSSVSAVIEGLISLGRKDITPGWFDIDIYPRVKINNQNLELSFSQLTNVMSFLGKNLPKGSHIMFSYSMITGETDLHKETWRALQKQIPEPLTPIGELLVHGGALSFKNWYFAEGALEGNIKLQGNIPLDKDDTKTKARKLMEEIEKFTDLHKEYEDEVVKRACERFDRIKRVLLSKLETGI